jgi:hypothetical protein
MGLDPFRGDTQMMLQLAQAEREKLIRLNQEAAASRVLMAFSERHEWPGEDLETVMQALGLIESPPPLKKWSR